MSIVENARSGMTIVSRTAVINWFSEDRPNIGIQKLLNATHVKMVTKNHTKIELAVPTVYQLYCWCIDLIVFAGLLWWFFNDAGHNLSISIPKRNRTINWDWTAYRPLILAVHGIPRDESYVWQTILSMPNQSLTLVGFRKVCHGMLGWWVFQYVIWNCNCLSW